MEAPRRLADFVAAIAAVVERGGDERAVLAGARGAMRDLVAADDWLPDAMAQPHPTYYQQYLLHLDAARRFSVVSFVWGPGQQTPIHDHTVWGVIGMLRGAEIATPFTIGNAVTAGRPVRLEPGDVECVGRQSGDVHRVANAYADRVSISVHCYGADIGSVRRHVYDPVTGAVKEFVSGYANAEAAGRVTRPDP